MRLPALLILLLLLLPLATASLYIEGDLQEDDIVDYEIGGRTYQVDVEEVGEESVNLEINDVTIPPLEEGELAYVDFDEDDIFMTAPSGDASELAALDEENEGILIHIEEITNDRVSFTLYGDCDGLFCEEEEGDEPDLTITTVDVNFTLATTGRRLGVEPHFRNLNGGILFFRGIEIDDDECGGDTTENEELFVMIGTEDYTWGNGSFTCTDEGPFTLFLTIDPDDDYEESDEENNLFEVSYTVEEGEDVEFCDMDDECEDYDPDTVDACVNRLCEHTPITACIDGDGSCPSGCTYTEDADCPLIDACEEDSDCDDDDPATKDTCIGRPKTCWHEEITECHGGDDFCPPGCVWGNDDDCQRPDACSRPSDCDDHDPSTRDTCTSTKPRTCLHEAIEECVAGDAYCPPGCAHEEDADCPAADACRTAAECDDENPCTEDLCSGDLKKCSHDRLSGCISDGKCIPAGFVDEDSYCDGREVRQAKEKGSACSADYECAKELPCHDGTCGRPGFFAQMWQALKEIFS